MSEPTEMRLRQRVEMLRMVIANLRNEIALVQAYLFSAEADLLACRARTSLAVWWEVSGSMLYRPAREVA